MSQMPGSIWAAETVADSPVAERGAFIRRTYLHLLGAILGFAALQFAIFQTVDVAALSQTLLGGKWSWLIVLGAFMGVSWLAHAWAQSDASPAMQYAGLILYVVAEAVIFVPLLYIASQFYPGAIQTAAVGTLCVFGGITAFAFVTGKDFSFLGGILTLAGFAAIGVVICSMLFGFELGTIFTVLMIALAGGYILYETSNVMHHYRPTQHVAASLALFASVALMFWYVLRLVMSMQRSD